MSDKSLTALLGSYDNLNEPEPNSNKRETVLGVTITCMILSWACGLFRFYTRFYINYAPGWDDFFLLLVLLAGFWGAICICLLPQNGLGQHYILLPADQMVAYLKTFYLANSAYIVSTTLIKISLLLQYLRVFKEGILRKLCYLLLVISSLWGLAFSLLAWIPCVPVHDFWDIELSSTKKTCFAYGSLTQDKFVETYLGHAGFNMTLDVLILSLPACLFFKKSDTPLNRKGLIGLLLGGCLVVSISTWRLATLVHHKAATYPTFDPSWYSPISIILSAAEVDVASICASIPVFWPVLTDSIGEIFVTKEIQIIHEERGDEFELHCSLNRSRGTFDEDSIKYPEESLGRVISHVGSETPEPKTLGGNPFASVNDVEEKDVSVQTRIRRESVTRS